MYGDSWTAPRVVARLTEAFRRMPGTAIYSPRRSELFPLWPVQPVDGIELIAATADILGRDSRQRVMMLSYCRARGSGQKVAQLCRERGWSRATLYRTLDRAAAVVAQRLAARQFQAPKPDAVASAARESCPCD